MLWMRLQYSGGRIKNFQAKIVICRLIDLEKKTLSYDLGRLVLSSSSASFSLSSH